MYTVFRVGGYRFIITELHASKYQYFGIRWCYIPPLSPHCLQKRWPSNKTCFYFLPSVIIPTYTSPVYLPCTHTHLIISPIWKWSPPISAFHPNANNNRPSNSVPVILQDFLSILQRSREDQPSSHNAGFTILWYYYLLSLRNPSLSLYKEKWTSVFFLSLPLNNSHSLHIENGTICLLIYDLIIYPHSLLIEIGV